jgi:hypothetical protein
MTPALPPMLKQIVTKAAGDRTDLVDWNAVQAAGLAATGIPTPITPAPADLQASDAPPHASRSLPAATNAAGAHAANTRDADPGDATVIISGRTGVTTVAPRMVPPVAGVSLPTRAKPQEAALQVAK